MFLRDADWNRTEQKHTFPSQIAKRLHNVGKEHLVTIQSYPGAGHIIDVPYANHARLAPFVFSFSDERGEKKSIVYLVC